MKLVKNVYKWRIAEDLLMIALGVALAVLLVRIGVIDQLISYTQVYFITAFISGIFFTSAFTVAPASVVLIQIAEKAPVQYAIFFGALGALIGDLLLFYFIRDRFSEDVKKLLKKSTLRHIVRSFHFGFLRWLAPILGAALIVLPGPDEFGISLLGMSNMKTALVIPVSFFTNMLGIYLLVQLSHLV